MDRSWLRADRRSREFHLGVEELLMFAFANGCAVEKISCPCTKCAHSKSWTAQTIRDHLYQHGIDEIYTCWIWHRESESVHKHVAENSTESKSVDQVPIKIENIYANDDYFDSSYLFNHVQGDHKPLYPGCKDLTRMKALVKLYNLKAKYEMSDSCFSEMLFLLGSMLLDGNTIPSSFGEAKKTLCSLGMEYKKIHVYPNDCLLYCGERDENEMIYRICQASRWKLNKNGDELEGIPAKVLWYFSLIPCLRTLFNSPQTAKDLTWHDTGRLKDGKLRHPADAQAWKEVDHNWPEFASDLRNLRLALSSDGFSPFNGAPDYSMWLSLLIVGPTQPGNDIDVFLQPLIEELQKLWHGKQVYNAYSKESFTLRGTLLWTISDFPAYGNLSGNIIKGYNGCPICVDETKATRLPNYHKMVVLRHRRWLPRHHPYRRQKLARQHSKEDKRQGICSSLTWLPWV